MSNKHAQRLEWTRDGKCRYRVRKSRKCEGPPGYEPRRCEGSYTDEYGSYRTCSECGGRGVIDYLVYMRVPEFDAPQPKLDWEPDWIESQ